MRPHHQKDASPDETVSTGRSVLAGAIIGVVTPVVAGLTFWVAPWWFATAAPVSSGLAPAVAPLVAAALAAYLAVAYGIGRTIGVFRLMPAATTAFVAGALTAWIVIELGTGPPWAGSAEPAGLEFGFEMFGSTVAGMASAFHAPFSRWITTRVEKRRD